MRCAGSSCAVITVLASLVPARRAVQVPPVAALTEVAVAAPAGRGIVRTVIGVVLLVASAVGLGATLFGDAGAAPLGGGAVRSSSVSPHLRR